MMRVPSHILLLAILTGCVVPYGEVTPTSAPAQAASSIGDLTGLEARVLLLLDQNQDADRAARLEALRALLRRSRTWPPEAQRDLVVYLKVLLDVEERWRADEGLDGFPPVMGAVDRGEILGEDGPTVPLVQPVAQESLDPGDRRNNAPEAAHSAPPSAEAAAQGVGAPPETVAPERDGAAMRAEAVAGARQALARGAYLDALELLRELPAELDEEVGSLWEEAVDGYVHAERERAGTLFLEARNRADLGARKAGFEEVAGILRGLLEEYPESSYAAAIARNLQLVEQELGTLEVGQP